MLVGALIPAAALAMPAIQTCDAAGKVQNNFAAGSWVYIQGKQITWPQGGDWTITWTPKNQPEVITATGQIPAHTGNYGPLQVWQAEAAPNPPGTYKAYVHPRGAPFTDGNSTNFGVTGDATVDYTLTMSVSPVGSGTTDPAVGSHTYPEGTVVNITATAEDGYVFIGWTGDVEDSTQATTTVTMYTDQSVTANFEAIVTTLGSITVEKVDQEEDPLAGATFQLWQGDTLLSTVTMTSGTHTWQNLEAGTYTVVETAAPAGYLKDDPDSQVVVLTETDSAVSSGTVYFMNTAIVVTLGAITVDKMDQQENPLAGATFQLWQGDALLSTVTMTSGIHTWYNLEAGTYTVIETAAPAGYLKDDPDSQVVVLTETEFVVSSETVYFMNTAIVEPTLGSITVEKYDDSDNPLAGATFQLWQGTDVISTVTMTSGTHTWHNLSDGTYTVVETAAPAGYVKAVPDYQHVLLVQEDLVVSHETVSFINAEEPNPSLTLKKYVSVNGGATWLDAEAAPGPTLWQGTNPVFKFVVTNSGNVTLYDIQIYDEYFGGYIGGGSPLEPGEGELTLWMWDAVWTQGQHANTAWAYGFCEPLGNGFGESTFVSILDEIQPCAQDSDMAHYFGRVPTPGPTGTLTVRVVKTDDGNVSGLPVTIGGAINATLTTNASGVVNLAGLYAGTYTADSGDAGYTSDGPRSTTLVSDSASGEIIITLTPVPPALGAIHGIVIEEDTEAPLAGATVAIFGPGGVAYTTVLSDANGEFHVANVPPGQYTAVASLEGYDSDTDIATVVAGEMAQMVLVLAQVIVIPPEPPAEPELPKTGATYLPNMAAGLGLILAGLGVRRRRRG